MAPARPATVTTALNTALEALSSAVELKQALGGTLDVALYGAQIQPAASPVTTPPAPAKTEQ